MRARALAGVRLLWNAIQYPHTDTPLPPAELISDQVMQEREEAPSATAPAQSPRAERQAGHI